nr:MAG TPA: hypothetical protein [Caudoviricetes sp.]
MIRSTFLNFLSMGESHPCFLKTLKYSFHGNCF